MSRQSNGLGMKTPVSSSERNVYLLFAVVFYIFFDGVGEVGGVGGVISISVFFGGEGG